MYLILLRSCPNDMCQRARLAEYICDMNRVLKYELVCKVARVIAIFILLNLYFFFSIIYKNVTFLSLQTIT